MPFPVAAAISAGGDILSQGINAIVQGATNRKNRAFAREMYARERADSLADWAMQNEYNSPAAQMQRFKDAKLNPHLIYGQGNVATPVRSASGSSGNAVAPRIDAGKVVNGFLVAKQMELQNDNLRAQNSVLLEQAKNIAQDTLNKTVGYDIKNRDLDWTNETWNMRKYRLEQSNVNAYRVGNNLIRSGELTDAQRANTLERTKSEVAFRSPRINQIMASTSESLQRAVKLRIDMAKSQAEIDQIGARVFLMDKEGKLKDAELKLKNLEERLKRQGLTWNDPLALRQLATLVDELF